MGAFILGTATIVFLLMWADEYSKIRLEQKEKHQLKLAEKQQKLEAQIQFKKDHPYHGLIKWFFINIVLLGCFTIFLLYMK